jgi:DNA-binding NarL/FixJ family response regulator
MLTQNTSPSTGADPPEEDSRPDRRVKLTPQQLEIALLMADGLSTKQIAARVDVSVRTVEYHRRTIYGAVG